MSTTKEKSPENADDDGDRSRLSALSTAQRARAERSRLRARTLRESRLAQRPPTERPTADGADTDTGGGFLLAAADAGGAGRQPRCASPPLAPAHGVERPHCVECARPFPRSHLLDTFGYAACDECRDDSEAHALLTRTEAKGEFLLKDCDLDARQPPLRCVRRRNPHSARYGDMRLYLRAQVEERALQVWGSEEALLEERERRDEARARTKAKQTQRRLRALRMDVRSSLYENARAAHAHEFGAETYDAATDAYSRACASCGHVETYEKM